MTERVPGAQDPIAKYPFRIQTIFFERVEIKRAPQIPEKLEMGLSAQIAAGLGEDGRQLTVRFKVASPRDPEPPVCVDVVAVALVERTGEGSAEDSVTIEFINEHLLVAMSSLVIQLIGAITAQMGMSPMWLPHPRAFGLDLEKYREMIARASNAPPDQTGTSDS